MLFLAHVAGDHPDDVLASDPDGPWREVFPLAPGLAFLDSDQSRSRVYHALKDHLPSGTPLLVAELHEVPKFKGMAPGALAWARSRA
ncbi:hypothetical protein [Euzebya sp.]|uniref:hypothetical protein n=1 Tax=Euzebya sp. TaxID=1971409 RepID=UPI0035195D9A